MEKKRILVVDDEKALVKTFKEILELEGHLLDTAMASGTPIEAHDRSQTKRYPLESV